MFQKGDVVVCTNSKKHGYFLTEGREYTVKKVEPGFIRVDDSSGEWYSARRFKLKEEQPMKEQNKPTPRKHATVIKAWADGYEVQAKAEGGDWEDVTDPEWISRQEYRVKPPEPVMTSTWQGVGKDFSSHIYSHRSDLDIHCRPGTFYAALQRIFEDGILIDVVVHKVTR